MKYLAYSLAALLTVGIAHAEPVTAEVTSCTSKEAMLA